MFYNPNPGSYPGTPAYGQQVIQYPSRNRQPPVSNQFPPTGNVVYADSLEHALSMPTGYHSDNVYFDSTRNFMYRIYTNERGEKSYQVFDIMLHQDKPEAQPAVITQEAYNNILQRLGTVENILEVKNEKSNVTTNGTSESTASTSGHAANAQ